MRIAVLGASGSTGRQLTSQALERGHDVVAVVRDPSRLPGAGLEVVAADATDPAAISRALNGVDVVVSGLGDVKGAPPGVLTAGVRAVLAAEPPYVVWLGAFGTGGSAPAAGSPTVLLLSLVLGKELPDKRAADDLLLPAGAAVFHAGPLTDGPLSPTRISVPLGDLHRPGLLASRVSRATVASQLLDEAEHHRYPGQLVVPLSERPRDRISLRSGITRW